jgi:hypothetical protein
MNHNEQSFGDKNTIALYDQTLATAHDLLHHSDSFIVITETNNELAVAAGSDSIYGLGRQPAVTKATAFLEKARAEIDDMINELKAP